MDANEWLATWEPIEAPGKHTAVRPAQFASGYTFDPINTPTLWDRVIRAIPVDGTVSDPEPAWMRSPQVRYWLQKEKPGLGERIRNWLRRPA